MQANRNTEKEKKRSTFVPWSLDSTDHCDSSNDAKKSLIAGSEISTPDVSRKDLHDSLTAEKISVGGGRGIMGGESDIASFVEDIISKFRRVPRG